MTASGCIGISSGSFQSENRLAFLSGPDRRECVFDIVLGTGTVIQDFTRRPLIGGNMLLKQGVPNIPLIIQDIINGLIPFPSRASRGRQC